MITGAKTDNYLYSGVEWQGIKNSTDEWLVSAAASRSSGIAASGPLWCTRPKYAAGTTLPTKMRLAATYNCHLARRIISLYTTAKCLKRKGRKTKSCAIFQRSAFVFQFCFNKVRDKYFQKSLMYNVFAYPLFRYYFCEHIISTPTS